MKTIRTILTLTLTASMALLLAVSLASCGAPAKEEKKEGESSAGTDTAKTEQNNQEKEVRKPLAVTTITRANYRFDLPETISWEEGDGDLDLMKEGKVVGGIWALDYDHAESLRDPAVLEGAMPAIVEMVAPVNSSFSAFEGAYGDFSIGFVQEGGNTVHTFFAQGDTLFDVWVLDESFTKEETETIFGSFALEKIGTEVG